MKQLSLYADVSTKHTAQHNHKKNLTSVLPLLRQYTSVCVSENKCVFTNFACQNLYLTCVIRGWVHLLLMPLCSSHWFSGWGQCCFRVQRFSPLHQTHPNSGSAFRHKPQLPRWASHLYRWTVQERGTEGKVGERGEKRVLAEKWTTFVQMITDMQMNANSFWAKASEMMDKCF